MTDLRISEASEAALRDRLRSPEGKKALLKLVDFLGEVVVDEIAREVQKTGQSLKKQKKRRGAAKS